jgi:hypothetical protein
MSVGSGSAFSIGQPTRRHGPRDRDRQGVSQPPHDPRTDHARLSHVHQRTGPGSAIVDRSTRRARCRVCQSSADSWRAGATVARRRGEFVERPNAYLYETGGLRRTHERGHQNIAKRLLVQAAACNLGLFMRRLIGIGTPRGLQGRVAAVIGLLVSVWHMVTRPVHRGFRAVAAS